MPKTKVAIACQGGGSQTAFTAGALKGLMEAWEQGRHEFEIVSISGTSGGALCAALLWYSYVRGDRAPWRRLIDFWHDNTAHDWIEAAFNEFVVRYVRSTSSGLWPAFQLSPASPMVKMMRASIAAMIPREEFVDLARLLRKYIDFEEVASWGPRPRPPVLVVGTANVTTGRLVEFSSLEHPILLDELLASCCVPSIFPAVMIDSYAYWDGLFSDNPPITELIRPRTVGRRNIPNEIWLIKINPTARTKVPLRPDEIHDRHNQLQGNISLFQQLDHLEALNDMILVGAFRPEFLAHVDIQTPIRIPRLFGGAPARPYHIPCIEMPKELQDTLDYSGKLDRSAENIGRLLAIGEESARMFIEQRAKAVAADSDAAERTAAATLKGSLQGGDLL